MKNVWIKAVDGSWEQKRNQITSAMEAGADFVLADAFDLSEIKKLGKIKTACFVGKEEAMDADILVWEIPALFEEENENEDTAELKEIKKMKSAGRTVAAYVDIQNKKTELFAATVGKTADYLIISAGDWRIIPLENLIAALEKYDVEIIANVKTVEETQTSLQILERGVDGVLIDSADMSEIKEMAGVVKMSGRHAEDLSRKITVVKQLGKGGRGFVWTPVI